MKRGKEKILQGEDVLKLSEEDRKESCYSSFLDQLNKQKQKLFIDVGLSLVPLIIFSKTFTFL
jgi:ATP-binding cassette, subfamily C (CFTR/MRP), member 2